MDKPLPLAEHTAHRPVAMIGAVLLASVLFLLIPLTQKLNNAQADSYDVREIVTIPPPPIAAPPPKKTQKEPEPEPLPKFEQQVQAFTISQLELSLSPGIGDALRIGVKSGDLKTDFDTVSTIQEMFTFSDLEQAPSIINQPRVQYPTKLARRGIKEGRVVAKIEINERGRASVIRIISSTSPDLIAPALGVIRQARFTQPKIEGKPTKVQGDWPIVLRAPN